MIYCLKTKTYVKVIKKSRELLEKQIRMPREGKGLKGLQEPHGVGAVLELGQ